LTEEESNESRPRSRGRRQRRRWVAIVLTCAQVIGALTSVHALMSVRTPQGSIAWIISLNTAPLIAVPAYWVLGRNEFKGYVLARQTEDEDLRDEVAEAMPALAPFFADLSSDKGSIEAAERLAMLPFFSGNDVELLIDGQATFDSILAGMDKAEEYLLVQFFIVKDDTIGRRLKERMLKKAAEGVKVLFLYDEIGSHKLPKSYVSDLRNGGVQARAFHSTQGRGNRFQLNFRNHRKIVIADGRTAWIGGHNVGDEYVDGHPTLGHWRDTHVRITGPAVMAVQVSFSEDWNWATGEEPELTWEPVASPSGDVPVLILPSGPADGIETASLMYQQLIHAAADRVWIASPYFVPDEGVMGALYLASLRGVDVRILIPDQPDHLLVYLAAYAFLKPMLAAGTEVYRYETGFMHQKVFLVDDVASGIGTVNLDNRSFRLNFEITAVIVDAAFTAEVESMLRKDFAASRLMTIEDVDNKSYAFRVFARASYLAAPIL